MSVSVDKSLIPSDPRFGVGPSLIPQAFLESLLKTGSDYLGTSHRKAPVISVVKEIQSGLLDYFKLSDEYLVCIGNGGASFLFDMIGLGLVKKKSAHFCCGEFSNKWFNSHANIPWIETEKFSVELGEGLNPHDVEDADMICATLNETSTGVIINDIPDLSGTDKLFVLDATSGGGQVLVDMKKVDVFFLSPQKVMGSEGGTFVAILSPKAQKRALEIAKNNQRYIPHIMDWEASIAYAKKHQTLNTPSLSSLFFFNEQVKLMNKLGAKAVEEQALAKAKLVYDWAKEKEYLKPFVDDDLFRSHSVAVIDVLADIDLDGLLSELVKEKIAYDIGGYRKIGKRQFRIGLFHNIALSDLEKLVKVLSLKIEENLDKV